MGARRGQPPGGVRALLHPVGVGVRQGPRVHDPQYGTARGRGLEGSAQELVGSVVRTQAGDDHALARARAPVARHHDRGYGGVRGDRRGRRTEQHPVHPALGLAPEHEEVGVPRGLDDRGHAAVGQQPGLDLRPARPAHRGRGVPQDRLARGREVVRDVRQHRRQGDVRRAHVHDAQQKAPPHGFLPRVAQCTRAPLGAVDGCHDATGRVHVVSSSPAGPTARLHRSTTAPYRTGPLSPARGDLRPSCPWPREPTMGATRRRAAACWSGKS